MILYIILLYIIYISGIVPTIERFPGSQVRQDMPAETIAQVDAMTQQDRAIYQRLASVFFSNWAFWMTQIRETPDVFAQNIQGPLKHDESRIDHLGGKDGNCQCVGCVDLPPWFVEMNYDLIGITVPHYGITKGNSTYRLDCCTTWIP